MDPITLLAQIPGVGPFIPYIVAAGVIAAVIATMLPPPAPGGSAAYAGFYRVVSWLALNVGKARNAGAPPPAGTPPAALGLILALIITGGVAGACTSTEVTTSLDDLKTGCGALAIAEQASPLTGGAAQTAAKVKAPFDAFCAVVNSGVVPGNADANSLAWLQTGTSTVSTIIALAK